MKVKAEVEQIVYNHLKKIGEVETIQELMVIRKSDPQKYRNIISSMYREIQQQRAEPRQQRTEPQRQQGQQRQQRQQRTEPQRQQRQQRQSSSRELTYTQKYIQFKKDAKEQIRDARREFNDFTSKEADLKVIVSSELSLNEQKLKQRITVQERCMRVIKVKKLNLHNAQNILEKYPSVIKEGKIILATIKDDALAKEIEIMEQELAEAIKTVAKLDGKLNKMFKTAKVVAWYMLTLGKRERSHTEELMLEIGRIK